MLNYTDMRFSATSLNTLNDQDLKQPRIYSLSSLLPTNPGLMELLRLASVENRVITAGSGAFIPGLLCEGIFTCPVICFQSKAFTDEALVQLAEGPTMLFSEVPKSQWISESYFGWDICPSTLCVPERDLAALKKDDALGNYIIVLATNGDALSIGGFYLSALLLQTTANNKNTLTALSEQKPSLVEHNIYDFPDDIDFGDADSANWCVAPHGERANIMRISMLNDNVLLVPTCDVIVWKIPQGHSECRSTASEIWERIEDPNLRDRPIVAFATGKEIPGVIPERCSNLPLLTIYLPDKMFKEASLLADGRFTSENLISDDLLSSSTYLVFSSAKDSLYVRSSCLARMIGAVEEASVLILAIRCGPTIWIKYYAESSAWLENHSLTRAVSDSYKAHSFFSSEQIVAAREKLKLQEDANYEQWLFNESGLSDDSWIPSDLPFRATSSVELDKDLRRVWFPVLYKASPESRNGSDFVF